MCALRHVRHNDSPSIKVPFFTRNVMVIFFSFLTGACRSWADPCAIPRGPLPSAKRSRSRVSAELRSDASVRKFQVVRKRAARPNWRRRTPGNYLRRISASVVRIAFCGDDPANWASFRKKMFEDAMTSKNLQEKFSEYASIRVPHFWALLPEVGFWFAAPPLTHPLATESCVTISARLNLHPSDMLPRGFTWRNSSWRERCRLCWL